MEENNFKKKATTVAVIATLALVIGQLLAVLIPFLFLAAFVLLLSGS